MSARVFAASARRFAARRIVFPLTATVVRSQAGRLLRSLEASSRERPEILRKRRDERLRRLVAWAYETVPHYRASFARLGLRPRDIDGIADIGRLPILHRRDLQVDRHRLLSTALPPARHDHRATSGSTGIPLIAVRDRALTPLGQASWWQGLLWCGVHPSDPILDVAVPVRASVSRWNGAWFRLTGSRTLPIRAIMLRETEVIRRICAGLRPALVAGMPDQLLLLAEMIRERLVALDAPPRAVLYRGGAMPPHVAETVARTFQAPVYARYAAFEFVPAIAHSCEHGWLHVNAESYVVEIVSGDAGDDNGTPAGSGRVLVTDLLNPVAPLLRYEIGDLAESAPDGPCPCGRTWPRMGRIEGRALEFAYAADGRRLTAVALERAMHVALPNFTDHIWEYQFVQERPGELELRVVPKGDMIRASADRVAATIMDQFDRIVRMRVTFTDHIPRAPSGKRPLIENAIDAPSGTSH